MQENNLFRSEVITNRRNQNYGSVSINTPVQYFMLTIGVSLLMVFIFLFLIKGEFSEKFIVDGYLESTKGMVRIYSHKNGIIMKQFVKQGEAIKKGDKLFLITTYDDDKDVYFELEKRNELITAEITSKKNHLHNLKQLLDKKYISLTTYDQKHDELIALEQQKSNIEMDIINYNHQKSYVIRAPIDGLVSNILYREGQQSNLSKPLAKILPANANLIAALFIPVKHAGFLHHNNEIILRYDAYPYARFGTVRATIDEISPSILTDEEEDKPIRIGQPYYKATALLNKQFITIYGKPKKISQGMTLTAVIVGSRKKIWRWILDPLCSFYGSALL